MGFDFAFPFGLIFLIGALLLFISLYYFYRYRSKVLSFLGSRSVLDKILKGTAPNSDTIKIILVTASWFLLTIALMGPRGDPRYQPIPISDSAVLGDTRKAPQQVLFLLDASASMAVEDTRTGDSRLDYAKKIVSEVLEQFNGEQAALYAFTSDLTPLVPFTFDYLFFQVVLNGVGINEGDAAGTRLTKIGEELFAENPFFNSLSQKTVILLSDGGDTAYETVPENQKREVLDRILQSYQKLADENVKIITIGIGSQEGGVVPNATYQRKPVLSRQQTEILELISRLSGSRYFPANAMTPFEIAKAVHAEIRQKGISYGELEKQARVREYQESVTQESIIYTLYFQIPLAIGIILLGIYLFWPRLNYASMIVLMPFLYADPNLINQAEKEFALHHYSAAQLLYERALNRITDPIKKNIVRYNLGTILLSEKKFEEAVEQFSTIGIGKNPFPLLARNIKQNLGIAQFYQAINQADPSEALSLLEQSLISFRRAQEYECSLEIVKGAPACEEVRSFAKMKDLIFQQIARILSDHQQTLIEKLSFQELFLEVFSSVQAGYSFSNLLVRMDQTLPLFQEYLSFAEAKFADSAMFWNSLLSKTEENNDKIRNAKNFFFQGLNSLKSPEKSRPLFESSLNFLKEVVTEFWGSELLLQIQDLIQQYKAILIQDPLLIKSIQHLIQIEQNILANNPLKPLQESIAQLQSAAALAQAEKTQQAKLFIQDALFLLKKSAYQQEETPQSILEASIREQKQAVQLTRQAEDLESSEILDLLVSSQSRVKQTTTPFIQQGIQKQWKSYQNPQTPSDKCQRSPWEYVFPPYTEGLLEVIKTEYALRSSPSDLSPIIRAQEEILSLWEEALYYLKNLPPEAPLQQQQQLNPLQLIQQMEQEDRKKKEAPVSPPGEYGW